MWTASTVTTTSLPNLFNDFYAKDTSRKIRAVKLQNSGTGDCHPLPRHRRPRRICGRSTENSRLMAKADSKVCCLPNPHGSVYVPMHTGIITAASFFLITYFDYLNSIKRSWLMI
jgi:hypothetical protein